MRLSSSFKEFNGVMLYFTFDGVVLRYRNNEGGVIPLDFLHFPIIFWLYIFGEEFDHKVVILALFS